jgi:hypothetical protein
VAVLGVVFAAMGAYVFEERGGEGGRPVEGARCDDSGSVRFSRGFLNIGKGALQHCTGCAHGRGAEWYWWHERCMKSKPIAPRDRAITCNLNPFDLA